MLNLKELTFSFRSEDWQDTFVGIKKNSSNKFEFHLPKGFENFPTDSYSSVKDLFFKTYKTYRKFFEEKKSLSDQNQLDGFSELQNGYSIESKDGQTVSYSKLNMLDSILDAYNELTILSVKNKLSQSQDIDYSRIHLYMHKAIFVDEDTLFVEEMEFNKKVVDIDSPTLVQLFCFIYVEIKHALEEEVESNRATSLANELRDKFLTHDSSIFEEETFEGTLLTLKDLLDSIDRTTPYKDVDYWLFYDAIYRFLYGENENPDDEDGNIWGITNFAILWEELCFKEAQLRLTESRLLFADRIGKTQTYNSFKSPFYLQINQHANKRRFLRPDLVYTNLDEENVAQYLSKIYYISSWVYKEDTVFRLRKYNIDFPNIEIDRIYEEFVLLNPNYNVNDDRSKVITSAFYNKFLSRAKEFILTLDSARKPQHLRPFNFDFTIIDYKYIAEYTCNTSILSETRRLDIQKQLVYEYAMQLNYPSSKTNSEFWIPSFFDNIEDDFKEVENLNRHFIDARIKVFKRNFVKLQQLYIDND
jgi:hypothetical protein